MTELEKLKMDDEYINHNDIGKRYLHNKLTPEETVKFEEYILDKPELLERLELDMVLVETLPDVVLEKAKEAKVNTNHTTNAVEKNHWWTPLLSHLTAVAASGALVAVVWTRTPEPIDKLGFSPNIVYLENYRSADNVTTLTFQKNETFKVLAIDVPPNNGSKFEVSIFDQKEQRVFSQDLVINDNDEIAFLLSSSALVNGEYSLELKNTSKIISEFDLLIKDKK